MTLAVLIGYLLGFAVGLALAVGLVKWLAGRSQPGVKNEGGMWVEGVTSMSAPLLAAGEEQTARAALLQLHVTKPLGEWTTYDKWAYAQGIQLLLAPMVPPGCGFGVIVLDDETDFLASNVNPAQLSVALAEVRERLSRLFPITRVRSPSEKAIAGQG